MLIIRYLFAVAVYINLMDHRTLCVNCLNLLGCNILTLLKIYQNTHKVLSQEIFKLCENSCRSILEEENSYWFALVPIFKQQRSFFRVYIASSKQKASLVHSKRYNFSPKIRANPKRQNRVNIHSSQHSYRPMRARVVSQLFHRNQYKL